MNPDSEKSKPPEERLVQTLAAGTLGTVVGAGVLAAVLAPQYRKALIIFLVVALVVGVVVGGLWFFFRAKRRKQRNDSIEHGVVTEFDKQSAASSDHDQKARLDMMKRKFMLLIEQLRADGQNIYDMPWFLTIGPSGTGKSWVLKAAGLEPLEDSEWKKGTFLIDWWTCNEALVLDTAGGLVFGEDEGYDTPDWKSLLGLVRKHRPQCPINGVFVVIPSQLLWLKPDEVPAGWLSLDEYADALRQQIRKQLQRTLGVRFPIYFFVTQSDRLPGFREFADALEANGAPCGQMLGWSNAAKVGQDDEEDSRSRRFRGTSRHRRDADQEPLNEIGDNLRQVVENLRRERMVLLNKYAGESARIDDVGMSVRERAADLFTFPDAIQSTLVPRLQDFLERVFRADPMLPKPPYLRGIYFTSALREGEVLDRQRASSGGKSLADLALPGGADKRQPKPFFIEDIFEKKAFWEWGLVTPLVEARRYLRERRRMLVWSGIGATVLLLGAIVAGGFAFSGTVGKELAEWKAVEGAIKGSPGSHLLPVVAPLDRGGFQLMSSNVTTHVVLARSAAANVEGASFWSFRWLFGSSTIQGSKRHAQLRLFESGVIRSLSDSARSMMLNSANLSSPPPGKEVHEETRRFEGAMMAALEMELCGAGTLSGTELEKSRDRVIDGYYGYLLPEGTNSGVSSAKSQIKTAFDETYSDKERRKLWPPASVKKGNSSFSNLVAQAFQRLKILSEGQTKDFRTELLELQKAEGILLDRIKEREATTKLDDALSLFTGKWNQLRGELEKTLNQPVDQNAGDFSSDADWIAARREQLRKRLQEVNGATQKAGTNTVLIKLLAEAFQSIFPEAGRPLLRSTNLALSRQQRIELYGRAIKITPQLPPGVDFLEDPPRRVTEIAKSIEETALRAWSELRTNVIADPLIDHTRCSSLLSNHIIYRHFEEALGRGEDQIISSTKFELPESGTPKELLVDFKSSLDRLNWLDALRKELDSRLRTQYLSNLSKPPFDERGRRIARKRAELWTVVKERISKEEREYNRHYPLRESEESATKEVVRDSWRRASDWRAAVQEQKIQAVLKDENIGIGETISDWTNRFEQLLDVNGKFIDYSVTAPWGDGATFEKVVGNSDHARIAGGQYRVWTWDGRRVEADDPKSSAVRVSVVSGFTLEARVADRVQEKTPTTIEKLPRKDAWTIVDLLRQSGTKEESGRYYVPINVNGDRGPTTVWFLVRRSEANK